jgi:hypothetical protein
VEESDTPAMALLEDIENYRFVLTEGRFVAGGGFDVQDPARAVISRSWMQDAEAAMTGRRLIELVLAWEGG